MIADIERELARYSVAFGVAEHRRVDVDFPVPGAGRDSAVHAQEVGRRDLPRLILAALVLAFAIIADQQQVQVRRDVELQLRTAAIGFRTVEIAPVEQVLDMPFDIGVESGEAHAHRIGDRAGHAGPRAVFVVLRDQDVRLAFERARRAFGHDVDHARARVLPEQRRLRAAQHFDAFDIDQVDEGLPLARQDDTVDHEGHAGFHRAREHACADAANLDRTVQRVGALGELH